MSILAFEAVCGLSKLHFSFYCEPEEKGEKK